ncbi:DNA-directed RNA polymerases II and V subunit 8A [Vanrija pseudolonga]|uniref:DNA-directed RNA polymerases II and V subunit 8A n=1 Tax=Vanrija pseudolonga TaxID=143232 RepID=A0AAF0Y9E4_9TREE|nr:DNA-directed RNA polymerases II and V subunit 8A [Vanrija pseudolonga]
MDERSNIIFEDRFTVSDVDKDGKKFDRVSRIVATSRELNMHLTLDIASELYPVAEGEAFALAVVRSLTPDQDAKDAAADENGDGADDEGNRKVRRELWRAPDQGLANDYDYVMHGKIYKFDDSQKGDNMTTAYFSFGGLLMALRGSYRHLANVVVGENVYLLMRK